MYRGLIGDVWGVEPLHHLALPPQSAITEIGDLRDSVEEYQPIFSSIKTMLSPDFLPK